MIGYRQGSPAPMLTQLPAGALSAISGPSIGVPDLGADVAQPADGDHAGAVGRHSDCAPGAVAGRGDDRGAGGVHFADHAG